MKSENLKQAIVIELKTVVEKRLAEANTEINSINSSKANETKSSAGDKYETGMAMLQQEEEKAHAQLAKAIEFNRILNLLKPNNPMNSVQLGALVQTNTARYFFSIPIGKVVVDGQEIFAISIASPIGQLMKNQKVGFRSSFQGKIIEILSIY